MGFAAWVERLVDGLESKEYVVERGDVVHWRFAKNAKAPPKKRAR